MRCHLTPIRMTSIENDKKSQVFMGIWRKENPHASLGIGDWCSHYGKQEDDCGGASKIKNRATL